MEKKTPLEFQEDIEIDRFIEMGYKIKMVRLDGSTVAVDYPEDIELVEKDIKLMNGIRIVHAGGVGDGLMMSSVIKKSTVKNTIWFT